MRDIIVLMLPTGRTIYLSPSFNRVTGHHIETNLREELEGFFHPDDFVWLKLVFAHNAAGDGQGLKAALTYRLRHADAHYIWLESQTYLVRDENGLPQHIQISARDVTTRGQAKIAVERKTAELRDANAALEIEVRSRQKLERNILLTIEKKPEQVGLQLHDKLGQDLTGIALLTKTLAQRLAGHSPGEADFARQISVLVNRTIGHTRMIAHGLAPYKWGNDGLVGALRQLAGDVDSLDPVKCAACFPQAVVISDQVVVLSLYRIAQEAVNNALKHRKAGKIAAGLTSTGRDIALAVFDNGHGMSQHNGKERAENQQHFHSIRHCGRAIDATLYIGEGKVGGTIPRVTWRNAAFSKLPVTEKESR